MGFKGNCQTCGNLRPLEICVGCGRAVCETHRGDEGSGYWNAEGKKGYGCGQCHQDIHRSTRAALFGSDQPRR
jgi:hypothetical protein